MTIKVNKNILFLEKFQKITYFVDKQVDWKRLEEEQRKKKEDIEKQKEMDRRDKLRMLVPEKSPRKNLKPLVQQQSTSSEFLQSIIENYYFLSFEVFNYEFSLL